MPSKEALAVVNNLLCDCSEHSDGVHHLDDCMTELVSIRRDELADLLDLAKREVAEALIRARCEDCRNRIPLERREFGFTVTYWDHANGLPCDSMDLHELLYQLQEREDGD